MNATVGVAVAPVGVAAAPVGVDVATAAAEGATVADDGAGAVVEATPGVERVPAHGVLGRLTTNSHGGNAEAGAVAPLQLDERNLSLINDTRPFCASALPYTVTPSATVTDVSARIVPPNVEPDPNAAELPTRQKTLHGLAPFTKLTKLDDAVPRSDVALNVVGTRVVPSTCSYQSALGFGQSTSDLLPKILL